MKAKRIRARVSLPVCVPVDRFLHGTVYALANLFYIVRIMCCFSQNVKHVSDTSIFCRMGAKGNQVVIYSMTLESKNDVAMILPIPVSDERDDDSVQFVDLSNYKEFFPQLDRGFPGPLTFGTPRKSRSTSSIRVQSVGNYAASFIPTVDDFDRVDEQFRIPRKIWAKLPQYENHGFVVFQLRAGKAEVHPMAFAYPAKDRQKIVFPTVHIHDGKVHAKAEFDHALYCQTDSSEVKMKWEESVGPLGRYINAPAAKGLVRGNEHVYKLQLTGEFENEDVIVGSA